jgi:Tol biopolymer transport system component
MTRLFIFSFLLLLILAGCRVVALPAENEPAIALTQVNSDTPFIQALPTTTLTDTPTVPTETSSVLSDGPYIYFVSADACVVQAVRVSGGDSITLTTNPPVFDCWRPKFSADGKKLAFVSQDGNYDLYTMNLDGSSLTKVADSMAFTWSPDSTQLAYHAYNEETQQGEIQIVNADGSDAHSLGFQDTPICSGCDGDIDMSWSPDGNWIYIASIQESADTYQSTGNLFNVDGISHVQFAEMEVSPFIAAAWSADSQQVAYPVSNFGDEPCENYLLIGSVTGETRLLTAENSYKTGEPGMAPSCFLFFNVAWSPDQNYILAVASPMSNFTAEKVTYSRILRVPQNGETSSLLNYWPGYPTTYLWAPDGSQFAFTSTTGMGDSYEEDGPLVLMQNAPDVPEYTVLADQVKSSSAALYWAGE